jgi:hypothetical protein
MLLVLLLPLHKQKHQQHPRMHNRQHYHLDMWPAGLLAVLLPPVLLVCICCCRGDPRPLLPFVEIGATASSFAIVLVNVGHHLPHHMISLCSHLQRIVAIEAFVLTPLS